MLQSQVSPYFFNLSDGFCWMGRGVNKLANICATIDSANFDYLVKVAMYRPIKYFALCNVIVFSSPINVLVQVFFTFLLKHIHFHVVHNLFSRCRICSCNLVFFSRTVSLVACFLIEHTVYFMQQAIVCILFVYCHLYSINDLFYLYGGVVLFLIMRVGRQT